MKKRLLAGLLAIAIMVCFCGVIAAGSAGSASDPLISLTYLTGTFKDSLLSAVDTKISSALDPVYNSAAGGITVSDSTASPYSHAAQPQEFDLKYGDTITGVTGTMYMLLAGSGKLTYTGTAVIDITSGSTVSSGTALTAAHRYLVAEDTSATVTITQDTAVLQVEASYIPSYSYGTDYYALTDALYKLGLFKGDGTSYGKGYALERTATRLEGLIMFIRLLGEEDAALAFTGSHPFSDVPAWAKAYVAYAYDKGYTNGVGGGKFGTNDTLTVQHYVTFIMRALGYSEGTDFTWSSAMDSAAELGVLTAGEKTAFSAEKFYRSKVAYLSFFTLSANVSGTDYNLLTKLINAGSVSGSTASSVMGSVSVSRIW